MWRKYIIYSKKSALHAIIVEVVMWCILHVLFVKMLGVKIFTKILMDKSRILLDQSATNIRNILNPV